MKRRPSVLASWTADEIAQGKAWVRTWKAAGVELERIRRRELREQDNYRAMGHLCGSAPWLSRIAAKPYSGLVEQQRWFMKAARHH